MNIARELVRAARELVVGRSVQVYKGAHPVTDVSDEEPDLDDLLYDYQSSVEGFLNQGGKDYEVEAEWVGRPSVEPRADAFVVVGKVLFKVFAKVPSESDVERAIRRGIRAALASASFGGHELKAKELVSRSLGGADLKSNPHFRSFVKDEVKGMLRALYDKMNYEASGYAQDYNERKAEDERGVEAGEVVVFMIDEIMDSLEKKKQKLG